jgi:hypothetical protein
VSDDCFRSLVISLVLSRLNYGNVALVELRRPSASDFVQSVLNAADISIFIYDISSSTVGARVTDALAIIHWLRVPERIDYKLALMTFLLQMSNEVSFDWR